MDKRLKVGTILYGIVLVGCTAAFFIQRNVVVGDHIRPGREHARDYIAVEIKEKGDEGAREADLRFLNSSVVTNPLRMGNELEEHMQLLLLANLATGIFLVFVVLSLRPKCG